MRQQAIAILLLSVVACSSQPSGPSDRLSHPTGTMLVATPNGPEAGTYLVDIPTGEVEQLIRRSTPFVVAFQGGYSRARNSIYGLSVSESQHIVEMHLANLSVDTLVTVPEHAWTGAFDISADGRSLAIQTATTLIRLWTVDLESGAWTQVIDQQNRTDSMPLGSIRWTPTGEELFVATESWPDPTGMFRIDLATQRFHEISPPTPITVEPWVAISPDGNKVAHAVDGSISFKDTNGALLSGLPEMPDRTSRPVFSPDGKFLAYQEYVDQTIRIMMVRLSDGRLWELDVDADFEVWLVDWISED